MSGTKEQRDETGRRILLGESAGGVTWTDIHRCVVAVTERTLGLSDAFFAPF
jgi:hypothetical protein